MIKSSKIISRFWIPFISSIRHYPYSKPFHKYLRNLPQVQCSCLNNGLVIASEERECYEACVGLFIKAGSRYESLFENGMTHFFEHIAFKGTKTQSKTVLEKKISKMGAHFHCFTTREMAVYYADCLSEDLPDVVELLAESVFNNCYSRHDISEQKRVVYSEMVDHDNNPNEVLYDYLHSTAFQGTPLARTVIGPSSNLYNFNECTISRYVRKLFDPSRTVLAAVGCFKHEQLRCLAETYLNILEPKKCVDTGEYRFTGSEVRFRDDSMPAANVAVAVEGPSFCDPDNMVMDIAATLIGGWDRSQPGGKDHPVRLARCASSGHFCDAYKSFNINYTDTGLWGCQFMTTSLKLEDMLYTVQDEWMRLCCMITDSEVEKAKREMKAKLLSKTESCKGACHDIGQWMLYNGHRPPIHERIEKIEKTFAPDVQSVCNRYIYDRCPAVAAVGQTEGLPEYTRIRAGMYWLRL